MLCSLSVSAKDLLHQPHELFLDSLELRGFNAVHFLVPDLEQDQAGQGFLAAAERRNFAVHARVNLMRQPVARDTAPVNALGQQLDGYECPSQPQAQDDCLAYCQGVAKMYPWAGIEILGLSFRDIAQHDVIAPELHFYRSICFCSACQYGYGAAGAILEHVAREAITDLTANPLARVVRHPSAETMLLWRRSVQYGLLRQIREAVSIPLCLRTAAELRYTGDRSSLTFEEAKGLVAACSVSLASGDAIELARLTVLPRPLPIYCCLPPADSMEISQHPMFSGSIR